MSFVFKSLTSEYLLLPLIRIDSCLFLFHQNITITFACITLDKNCIKIVIWRAETSTHQAILMKHQYRNTHTLMTVESETRKWLTSNKGNIQDVQQKKGWVIRPQKNL